MNNHKSEIKHDQYDTSLTPMSSQSEDLNSETRHVLSANFVFVEEKLFTTTELGLDS